ncbi:MAG: FTR1 family iron permease [Alphaproteobacteria bacterium]
MLSVILIVFRELFEAALIIGILSAATRGIKGRGVWLLAGSFVGVLGAFLLAFFIQEISSLADGVGQEIFSAAILSLAVVMLSWHLIWMRCHGKKMAQDAKFLGQEIAIGKKPLSILAVMAGLALLREGSEIVLFLYGLFASGVTEQSILLGSLLGTLIAVFVSVLLYAGLLRLSLSRLFAVTNFIILLIAAGMAAKAASFLVQADLLPSWGERIWNSSALISNHSILGQTLSALIGYTATPSGIEIFIYGITIMTILGLSTLFNRTTLKKAPTILSIAFLGALFFSATASAGTTVYSPFVEKDELEIEWRGYHTHDSERAKDNKKQHKLEIGYGLTDRWYSEIVFEFEGESGQELDHKAIEWENIFQLAEQGEYWVNPGLYLEFAEYEPSNKADKIKYGALLHKDIGALDHTANIIFKKEIGKHRGKGTSMEYGWQTKWRYMPAFEPALEVHGSLGKTSDFDSPNRQKHKAGPVILGKYKLSNRSKIGYEVGYLFGLNNATEDGTTKWLLEYEYYF